mmetsp:Transcript_7953/g.21072  ORF Transcript_7953/g.21072 Transcript_7953/m.21072 type:complete len:118 (+) Transcript_7953:104-457(+)
MQLILDNAKLDTKISGRVRLPRSEALIFVCVHFESECGKDAGAWKLELWGRTPSFFRPASQSFPLRVSLRRASKMFLRLCDKRWACAGSYCSAKFHTSHCVQGLKLRELAGLSSLLT